AHHNTMMERYGVTNPIHIDGMGERLESIFLERYGVKNPLELANKNTIEQNEWLDYHGVNPENREIRIDLDDGIKSGWIRVDGYDPEINTIYEYWGDLWHGNLNVFDAAKRNPYNNKTMQELNEETEIKRNRIIDAGYNLIEIWES